MLDLYIGETKDFDDLLHFYFQTLRVQLEADGIDWKAHLEQMHREHRAAISREFREKPWTLSALDAETFNSLYARVATVFPDTALSGSYRMGLLVGEASWEGIHALARFDSPLIRIDLANLA